MRQAHYMVFSRGHCYISLHPKLSSLNICKSTAALQLPLLQMGSCANAAARARLSCMQANALFQVVAQKLLRSQGARHLAFLWGFHLAPPCEGPSCQVTNLFSFRQLKKKGSMLLVVNISPAKLCDMRIH